MEESNPTLRVLIGWTSKFDDVKASLDATAIFLVALEKTLHAWHALQLGGCGLAVSSQQCEGGGLSKRKCYAVTYGLSFQVR